VGKEASAVLSLDQGTTSSRAMIFAKDGTVLGAAQREFAQFYPQPGWVEHDPEAIWQSQKEAIELALKHSGLRPDGLAAIGVTNQRETCLLWDAETGRSLGNAIVWQCRRTAERCDDLRSLGWEPIIRERTGLRLDPYFSATKLEWLLAAHPEAAALAAEGRLRAGTVDSFLIWRLTGGQAHVTDYSNASRTMLFDIRALDWDDELLSLFGVPREILAEPRPSSGPLGLSDPRVFGAAVPIAGVAGDQQASLFGHACLEGGEAKNTYGTGCFLLMNTGSRPVPSSHGLLTTIAWALGPDGGASGAEDPARGARNVTYALEGSVFVGGAAVQWLRDGLGVIDSSEEIGPLAAQVPDNGGLFFVPALAGLGAPFWDPYARGLLIGITRGTTRAHLARATEEAICYQTRSVLEAMSADAGVRLKSLRVDGGAVGDDLLLQAQADLLGIPVERPRVRETTALGAAALAGLAVGFWTTDDVRALSRTERVFEPVLAGTERERLYAEWQRAAERSLHWAK
jgi:glycerol kinase